MIIHAAAALSRHAFASITRLAGNALGLGVDLPAAAVYDQHAIVTMKFDAVVARFRAATNRRRVLPDHTVIRVRPDDLRRIRRLFGIVWEAELAADRRRRKRRFDVH